MKIVIILLSINTIMLISVIWILNKMFEIILTHMNDIFSSTLDSMKLTAEYTAKNAAYQTHDYYLKHKLKERRNKK